VIILSDNGVDKYDDDESECYASYYKIHNKIRSKMIIDEFT